MLPGIPNPAEDGSNWTVLFGGFDDEDAGEEVVGVVALMEDDELPGVTEREFRFELFEDSAEKPHAVYYGSALHRHSEEVDAGCETFHAEDDETNVHDIPDDLVEAFEEIMEMEVHSQGAEPVDSERVTVADLMEPDTEPGGMFQ